MPELSPPRHLMLFICSLLVAVIFICDIYTPLGIADGILYDIPLLMTLWLPSKRSTLLMAASASLLVIVGGYLSPHSAVVVWMALVNRIMALLVIWSVALLVLQRKEVEAKLRRSESGLAEAQALAHLGNWDWNIVSNALDWSDEIYRVFGIEPHAFDASYPAFLRYVHPDDRTAVETAVQSAIQQQEPYGIVHRIVRPNGVERVVSERGTVHFDLQGKPQRMIGTVQDITDQWHAEQVLRAGHDALEHRIAERTENLVQANSALQKEIERRTQTEIALGASELRLRTVISGAPVILSVLDSKGVFQLFEGRGLASLGLHPGEAVGQSVFDFYASSPQLLAQVRCVLAGENVAAVVQVEGEWFDVRYSPILDAQGAVSEVIGVATNVTELRQAELSRLAKAGEQRDTLIREVHHRIKNNLQGVIGLLRTHSLTHPKQHGILERAITQVNSVATVHGLYSEHASMDIMLCDMLRAISRSLNEVLPSLAPLSLDLAVDKPIQVAKDEAVPIALIMNELILNALKHGRREGDASPVSIRLQGDCESVRLSVRNGGMLPPDFSLAQRRGMGTGLNLVLSLLPHRGADLAITEDATGVITQVTLAPPVICSFFADDVT
jgi:PAS domain S-box-containing protein